MAVPQYIRFRRDDSEMWSLRNPVLREGEPGFETDSRRIKVGDGRTKWNDLLYIGQLFPTVPVSPINPDGPIRARTIKIRRDIQADWIQSNPVLSEGEPGFETDTQRIKVGDGETAWNDLPYLGGSNSGGSEEVLPANLIEHVHSPNPHPVYDDGPSLLLLYNNLKV